MRAASLALLCLALSALGGCAARPVQPDPWVSPEVDPARQIVVTLHSHPVAGLRGAGSTWRGWDISGGYRASSQVQKAIEELGQTYGLRPVDAWPIDLLGVHCVAFEIVSSEMRDAVLARLASDPRVESAQAMQAFATAATTARHAHDSDSYDDTFLDLQFSLETMQVRQAHRWSQGRGVRVAVIDTGIDLSHLELRDRVVRHQDFVRRRQARALPVDASFNADRHGTAVAGVIAARAGNGEGIVGVAPLAELIALKACWPIADGSPGAICNSFTLAQALSAAVEAEADVLNLSLAGPRDPLLERLVALALGRGIAVVGAVPDSDNGSEESQAFPASVDGVIAVNTVERKTGPAQFAAPGVEVMTTAPGSGYDFVSGSSLAAAHVTGVVALLREGRPDLTPADLRGLLTAAVVPLASGDKSVSACVALSKLLGESNCGAMVVQPLR